MHLLASAVHLWSSRRASVHQAGVRSRPAPPAEPWVLWWGISVFALLQHKTRLFIVLIINIILWKEVAGKNRMRRIFQKALIFPYCLCRVQSSVEMVHRPIFTFLCKLHSVLGKHPYAHVYFLSSDQDRATYSAAWEAPPPVYLLSRQLWQQQQEEGPSWDSR